MQNPFFLLNVILLTPLVVWASPHPEEQVLARVNGTPIRRSEVKAKERNGESESQTLDRVILYHLAVSEAIKQGLEKTPQVQEKLNQVLYKSYLDQRIAKAGTSLDPSERDLKNFYDQNPLIRLRHLVLRSGNDRRNKRALETQQILAKEIKKGVDFKQLVLKYSEDDGVTYAGDMDFRGVENLPEYLYRAGLSLKKGEVAGPLFHDKIWHYVQLIDKKTFQNAPATYLEFLKSKLRNEKTESLLKAELERLKKNATVELVKGDK